MLFSFAIDGAQAADNALRAASPSVAAAVIKRAERKVAERVREQFLSSGEAFGPGWLPLKKQPQTHPTLILTGALMHSFQVLGRSDDEILFGTELPYAQFSEFGTKYEPARPILTPELLAGIAGDQPA